MKPILAILAVCSLAALGQAKVFSECELARELLRQGIPQDDIPNWVCLVEAESGGNTQAINRNSDGNADYGLFQINSAFGCSDGNEPGKACYVTCQALLSDDISASVMCARIIFQGAGFGAWEGWRKECQGKALPDLSNCY